MKKFKLSQKEEATVYQFLTTLAFVMLVLVLIVCCGFRSPEESTSNIPENELKDAHWTIERQREILRAYNHLLHRVWVDKPNYVEDALCETDEFVILDELLGGEWEDTFSFYDEEDSLSYHENWNNGDETVRIIKHVVEIPEPTKSRLQSVFGNGD